MRPSAGPALAAIGALLAAPAAAPATVEELFEAGIEPRTRSLSISPDGKLVAIRQREGLIAYHIESETSVRIADEAQITGVAWESDDTLLVESWKQGRRQNEAVSIHPAAGGVEGRSVTFRIHGEVVDPLPDRPDLLLFAPENEPGAVYRVSPALLSGLRPLEAGDRVAQLAIPDLLGVEWTADHRGVVRAALALSGTSGGEQVLALHVRSSEGDPWRPLAAGGWSDFDLHPIAFAEDDEKLLVATNRARDTYGLYELDIASAELGRLRYAHPNAEILSVDFDFSGRNLLAVTTFEDGLRRTHFLASAMQRHQRALEKTFPGESIEIVSSSRDEKLLGVFVSSALNPGVFYTIDPEQKLGRVMGRVAPSLEPGELAPARSFRVRSTDGLEVEAILTALAGRARALVVMPHGGPIGIRDERAFDPLTQFLAARGYAVLQVNYRGSSGYGRAFEERGNREWGGRIEDDIESGVAHAIAQGWVDGARACIVGASYGGYSALMSPLRFPARYRCAASFAGVTDLALLVNRSEARLDEWLGSTLRRSVGDPERDYAEMKARSPVYRAAEFPIPLFLAQGDLDRIVDQEHAHRLRRMLDLLGKPYEWQLLEGVGHGFATVAQAVAWCSRLERFLEQHLGSAADPAPPR